MNRHIITIAAASFALVLASCGSGERPTVGEPVPSTTSTPAWDLTPTLPVIGEGVARVVAPEPAIAPEPELDAEQVVAAMVLIASGGDLEAAITAELIGEAEAEAALAALETGSIADVLD